MTRLFFRLAGVALAIQRRFVGAYEVESSYNKDTCNRIASSLSHASEVFFPSSPQYIEDINHFGASSSQNSTCSVEPGSVADLSRVIRILGETRTPFGVKGGGHATNMGFSSSSGIQIAMTRFSEININHGAQTVDVGAGLIWDDVYSALDQHSLGVLGGRVAGIGIAGFTLGGGYAWKSNEYGLAIDNVEAFELVLPDGEAVHVSEYSYPDLFFGLKGGYNNFGIVTKFTLKTFPQTKVWGGTIVVSGQNADAFASAATRFFANTTDPKASILVSLGYEGGAVLCSAQLFYDSPTPPAGLFDELLAIPTVANNVTTRSFASLVGSVNPGTPARVVFNTASFTEFSPAVVNAALNETKFWGQQLNSSVLTIAHSLEPFLPNLWMHGAPSAYPPSRERTYLPTCITFEWTSPEMDDIMQAAARQSAAQLTAVALADGQDISEAPLYSNYAIFDTPVARIYGNNMERLSRIKKKYDPHNVMDLAGGWKFY